MSQRLSRIASPAVFATTLILLITPASAQVLTQYTFPGSESQQLGSANNWDAPTTVAAGLTATKINATGSAASVEGGGGLFDTIFMTPNTVGSTTAATAVSNNEYFQFTLTPTGTNSLDLSSLTFDVARGGTSTPRGWVVRTSVDSFNADILTNIVPTLVPSFTPASIDLSGSVFQGLANPFTVRIYGYAPVPGVGLHFDNVTVNGTVNTIAVVPEAGTFALSLPALTLIGAVVIKRRKSA